MIVHTGHLVDDAVETFEVLQSPTRLEVVRWLRTLPGAIRSMDMRERDEGHDLTTDDDEEQFDAMFMDADERDGDLIELVLRYASEHPTEFTWVRP